MKQFKIIDFWVSVGLIISGFSIYLFNLFCYDEPFLIIYIYLIIGFWQVASMIALVRNKTNNKKSGIRHIYHWISFITLITLPLGSYWFLIILAAPMAIFYTFICWHEIFSTKKQNYEMV